MTRITVVGVGYVGLVTAAGLAHLGHDVTCVDTDRAKIDSLNAGSIPIFEAGLRELVDEAVAAQPPRLRFQAEHDDISFASSVYFLCVPTPQARDGSADVSFVEQAAGELATAIAAGSLVVNKSTVPVGSKRLVESIIGRDDIAVVSNPEFLREGTAVHDFLHPDRVVIGADDAESAAKLQVLYDGIETTFVLTDATSAELIKYAANSFLATKLSFINAVATVCEGYGADIADVRQGIGLDARIGLDFFSPGPGWGGSCFPKDTQVMLDIAEHAGYDFALVRAAISSNEQHLDRVAGKVIAALDKPSRDATVGLLGLAFKAETDDTRMSPALRIADRLRQAGIGQINGYDPQAVVSDDVVDQVGTAELACQAADVVVVATEWAEFLALDLHAVAANMAGTTLVDTRGVLDHEAARSAGLQLLQIGRG